MEVLVEKVRRYEFDRITVRIWTQGKLPAVHVVAHHIVVGGRVDRIAKTLLALVKANAVEVTRGRAGVVAYADWP